MLGMPGTSGGVRHRVNLIILLLIAFEIQLVIGRRSLVPIVVGGSLPAKASAWQGWGGRAASEEVLASRHWAKGREKEMTVLQAVSDVLDGWSPRGVRAGAVVLRVRKACGVGKETRELLSLSSSVSDQTIRLDLHQRQESHRLHSPTFRSV